MTAKTSVSKNACWHRKSGQNDLIFGSGCSHNADGKDDADLKVIWALAAANKISENRLKCVFWDEFFFFFFKGYRPRKNVSSDAIINSFRNRVYLCESSASCKRTSSWMSGKRGWNVCRPSLPWCSQAVHNFIFFFLKMHAHTANRVRMT